MCGPQCPTPTLVAAWPPGLSPHPPGLSWVLSTLPIFGDSPRLPLACASNCECGDFGRVVRSSPGFVFVLFLVSEWFVFKGPS